MKYVLIRHPYPSLETRSPGRDTLIGVGGEGEKQVRLEENGMVSSGGCPGLLRVSWVWGYAFFHLSPPGGMALPVAPAMATMLNDLRTIDTDLTFAWGESEVPVEYQWRLQNAGYNSIRKFTYLDATAINVRGFCINVFLLDPNAPAPVGAANRLITAAIVSSWDVCRLQLEREINLRAEAKTLNMQRPLTLQLRTAMRRSLETIHGKIPASELPSADYIAAKTEEIEQGEPMASCLDEVTSMEDIEAQSVTANLDLTGKVQIVKRKGKITMPTDPESFRMRLRVESHTWLMLATKHTNQGFLVGLVRSTWERYVDHFLGKKCYSMFIPTGETTQENLVVPWHVVMHYEWECRKFAFKLCRDEGTSLNEALMQAIRDSETKEVHFTTPIALGGPRTAALKRTREVNIQPAQQNAPGTGKKALKKARAAAKAAGGVAKPAPPAPVGGKAGGKGGKGRGKLQTKVGQREICYNFNNAGCNNAACERLHVCQVVGCQEAHPASSCPKR